jgi:hypothetical protein
MIYSCSKRLFNLTTVDGTCIAQSYVAILYFKIILQGHEVQHHRLVDDPIWPHELTCRPQGGVEHVMTESDV